MAHHSHSHTHGAGCNHDHDHDHHHHDHRILNKDNLDVPAEADIDLDAMHPEVQIPSQQWPLTEEELRDDFVMITEDGGIKKKIITESATPQLGSPPTNSKVVCHYTGTLPNQNDEKFDSSRDRNDPFSFKIGTSQVIKGWDIGIASMKKGERCILRCASPYAYGENGSPPKIPGGATLDFDVELLDWDAWQDCDGAEGQISKNIVIESDGGYDDDVAEDAVCTISYRVYWVNKNGIDQILTERKHIECTVDDDDRFTTAFHLALKSMKRGEKAVFKIKDNALINTGDIYVEPQEIKSNEYNHNKRVAPPSETTLYEIYLHSMKKAKEKYNAKNEERIEEGLKYKSHGNDLFKMTRFLGAIQKYKKALDWIDVDFSDEALAKQKEELIVSTNNNLALIYIKKKDWAAAIEHATKVLEKDPNNMKGLMRRGQARLQDGFLELSKKDLKKAQALDKSNTYVKKLLKICTIRHKEYVEKQQKLYAGMFGGKKGKKKKKAATKKKEVAEAMKVDEDVKETTTQSEAAKKENENEDAAEEEDAGMGRCSLPLDHTKATETK